MQEEISRQNRKAALHNLGCKVNAYETEAMEQQLRDAGYEIVAFDEKADVYVINTCSVTNMADRKSRQMLHRAKKMNPGAVIVAAGCYVQTAKEKTGLAVDADIILGNNHKKDLVLMLDQFFSEYDRTEGEPENSQPLELIQDINHSKEYETLHITTTHEHTRAFLKVQDGCNQFCSYCIIPYARGRVRSRDVEDVLQEIETLVDDGIREVVLTGIHLSSYGVDNGSSLLELIRRTAQIKGVERIRLGSLEPGIVTKEFAFALAGIRQICPHFHLSMQSGSDTVLKRMNRKYDTNQFYEKCCILREAFDNPALTTDVIVGFPGETEEEFHETVEFLKKIRFYETHIFKYSKRAGTAAARMKDQVSEEVKSKRSDCLLELNRMNMESFEQLWNGKKAEVLLEETTCADGRTYWKGHTKEYIEVLYDAGNREDDLTNRIISGIVEKNQGNSSVFLTE